MDGGLRKMEIYVDYIQAPYNPQPITIHKQKVKRIKRVKRNEVPQAYRKNRKAAIKRGLSEIWDFIKRGTI